MKRLGAAVLFLLIPLAGFMVWWFLRDTPEKMLGDGLRQILAARSASFVLADVSWTDLNTRVTTGFSFAGKINAKDLTRPEALGALRLGEGLTKTEETADLILEAARLGLRPRSVTPEHRKFYESMADDKRQERFAAVDRDRLFDRYGYGHFISSADSDGLRSEALSLIQTVRVDGSWVKKGLPGVREVDINFKLDRVALYPVVVSLLKSWNKENLTPDELSWAGRMSEGLSHGNYVLTMKETGRMPVQLRAEWPVLDDDLNPRLALRVQIVLQGLNAAVSIAIPSDASDITAKTLAPKFTTLPAAEWQTFPASQPSFSTSSAGILESQPIRMINEKDVDLFHKYLEEMKSKKNR